eukprot:2300305-Pyramimonas_sp.AAC.1
MGVMGAGFASASMAGEGGEGPAIKDACHAALFAETLIDSVAGQGLECIWRFEFLLLRRDRPPDRRRRRPPAALAPR